MIFKEAKLYDETTTKPADKAPYFTFYNLQVRTYKTLLDKSYLHQSTKVGGEISPKEFVIYPVIARYIGFYNEKLKDENHSYLQDKEMLMLLIIENWGYPKKLIILVMNQLSQSKGMALRTWTCYFT